ncbi:peptidase M, neutral zinc metallopeptidase, zinc-binding site [Chondrocystis sp. NIES-4102]|nr:peptidase M, neutral zinc metallopeptidase, zinc-binding site [Chondrocystis sp. NIES-4102]
MLLLLLLIFLGLGIYIFLQSQKLKKAQNLYLQAIKLEKKDINNPDDLEQLNQALTLYKQCSQLTNNSEYIKAANRCQKQIDKIFEFEDLVSKGRKRIEYKYFKGALDNFTQAQKLFVTEELEAEIFECQESIKQQENYERGLKESIQIAKTGRFQEAIDLLEPIINEFYCEDGQKVLSKLKQIRLAKELYKSGLIAESDHKFYDAFTLYQQALNLLPEFIECQIRIGIISVQHSPQQTITYLKEIKGEQAAYIRGFAHAQLGNWQQANREWRSIDNDIINSQREIIISLAERERTIQIKTIESAIDHHKIDEAKRLSLEFINKFGLEPIVQKNLENHIQPFLERQIWESENWQEIAVKTERNWLEQQDTNSLHNWAIATYHQAQINPDKLADFIIAWSTALANIEHNPRLQNVPWLGSNDIDIKEVSSKLKQIIEKTIDLVKDNNIEEYLILRDIYRREMVALSLMQQSHCGMTIKQQLFILAGCYHRFRDYFPAIKFPAEVWGSLYTDWGKAVAACHEGDTARAINIKPSRNPSSEAERFAYNFVSYHEGCYYLQNLKWRKAIKPLRYAYDEIKAKLDWRKEIDRLCQLQREEINDFDEHLQFSKFWYELIASQAARSNFAECKARKVAQKIADEEISIQQGLKELKEIQNIDPNNPYTLDLVEKAETIQEEENIKHLIRQDRFEEAVRQAKKSHHESIRFMVAEICIDILLTGAKNNSLPVDLMLKLGNWAYELCPREPAFQEIYSSLRIYR